MPRDARARLLPLAFGFVVSLGAGCSRQPPSISATLPDPAPVAAAAIAQLDRDGTDSLSVTEISASPGLIAVREQFVDGG